MIKVQGGILFRSKGNRRRVCVRTVPAEECDRE